MIGRRAFLTGLSALVAAPAVIRTPGLLMTVKSVSDVKGWVSLREDDRGNRVWVYITSMDEARSEWRSSIRFKNGYIPVWDRPCSSFANLTRIAAIPLV